MRVHEAKIGQPYIDSYDDLYCIIAINEAGVHTIEISLINRIGHLEKWFLNTEVKWQPISRSKFVRAIFEGRRSVFGSRE